MGLFIYCPVLTGNGIIIVDKMPWIHKQIQQKERLLDRCSGQHMLMALVRAPLWKPGGSVDNSDHLYIYYCQERSFFPRHSNTSLFMTGSGQSQTKSGHLCLVLQTNPFDGPSSTRADQCNYVDHIQSTHEYSYFKFDHILTLQHCLNVPCGKNMPIDSHGITPMNMIALWQNKGKQLFISYETQFMKLEMEVHFECQGFVSVSSNTDPAQWNNRLRVSQCSMHVIPFNDLTNAYALKWDVTVSLSHLYHWMADSVSMCLECTFSSSVLIGISYPVIRLKTIAIFPGECQDIALSIIYKDYTGNKLVTVTWNVDFRRSHDFSVHLYTVPFQNILIVVRKKVPKKPHIYTACDLLVEKHLISLKHARQYIGTVSARRIFHASYTYLWTRRNLSWASANATCSHLGMHLVSITNEDELNLVREFLIDETFLTPCRLETTLCVIFIGLQVKVGR